MEGSSGEPSAAAVGRFRCPQPLPHADRRHSKALSAPPPCQGLAEVVFGGQRFRHLGLHGMHVMPAWAGQITHVGGQARALWHQGLGHAFRGRLRPVTEQGHVEAPGVVVFRMKAARQPECVLQGGFLGWSVLSMCLVLWHFGPVIVQQGPAGQSLPQPQAFEPASRNRYGFHPGALTQRFSDDGLVFHRVKGAGGDDHMTTGSHQTGRATGDVHLQPVHVSA